MGSGIGSNTLLESTHVDEELSFTLFLSILTFDFYLILGSFLTYWGPNRPFLGLGKDSNTLLGSSHVVEQLSCSMIPYSDIWYCLNFGDIFGFLGFGVGVKNYFGVYSCSWTTFIFYSSFNSDFWFWLNTWVLFSFWVLMGYFWGRGSVQKLFWGLLM